MRKLSSLYPDTGRSSLARFHHVALIPLPSPPIKLTPQLRPEEREKERDRIDMESKAQAFRGVRRRKWGRWVSEIRIPKSRTRIWLGSYDAPEKAARAYDAAVYCLRGEVGKFNFPGERRPNLPEARRRTLTKDDVKAIAANHADLMTPPPPLPPPPISPLDEEDDCSLSNLSSNSFLLADAVVIEEMMSMWDIL